MLDPWQRVRLGNGHSRYYARNSPHAGSHKVVRKFGLKTIAITLHTGYWRSFDPDRKLEESDSLHDSLDDSKNWPSPFARLQDWCIEAKLKECSSATCKAIQQRPEPHIPSCKAWPTFRKWVLVAESCQMSAIANNFLWLECFNLEDVMYRLEEFWQDVTNLGLVSSFRYTGNLLVSQNTSPTFSVYQQRCVPR